MSDFYVNKDVLEHENNKFATEEADLPSKARSYLQTYAPGIQEQGLFFYAQVTEAIRNLSQGVWQALNSIDSILKGTTQAVSSSISYYRDTDTDSARSYDSTLEVLK